VTCLLLTPAPGVVVYGQPMTDSSATAQRGGAASESRPDDSDRTGKRVYRNLTLLLQLISAAGMIGFVLLQDWPNALLTALVIVLTLVPMMLNRWFRVDVPPEFQLAAALFVFCGIFLGMGLGFYARFHWWDTALHTTSGCLLGIVGFIAAFLINGTDHRPEGMRVSLIAVFGFMFAVTLGVFWEIYEFVVDNLIPGRNMQAVETGTTDTMVDLIVNITGAAIVAVLGYVYFRSRRDSFIVNAVREFLRRNPRLFAGRSVD
jgi:hypothetical protein